MWRHHRGMMRRLDRMMTGRHKREMMQRRDSMTGWWSNSVIGCWSDGKWSDSMNERWCNEVTAWWRDGMTGWWRNGVKGWWRDGVTGWSSDDVTGWWCNGVTDDATAKTCRKVPPEVEIWWSNFFRLRYCLESGAQWYNFFYVPILLILIRFQSQVILKAHCWFQTRQTGGPRCGDTSPFSIPC